MCVPENRIIDGQFRQENSILQLRGRRLVLEYRDGSPCGGQSKMSRNENNTAKIRRKSSLISFHCDKDPLAAPSSGLVTYVGNLDDECSYHFEVLSKVACATAEPAKQLIGPGTVFALIGIIAILVYFLGGIFYQRNVAHARGWRQLPNYSMWAGIVTFIKVSWHTCLQRLNQIRLPRLASIRYMFIPTMEVRSEGHKSQKSFLSKSSWDSTHLH